MKLTTLTSRPETITTTLPGPTLITRNYTREQPPPAGQIPEIRFRFDPGPGDAVSRDASKRDISTARVVGNRGGLLPCASRNELTGDGTSWEEKLPARERNPLMDGRQ
jgi:hypothetical protein